MAEKLTCLCCRNPHHIGYALEAIVAYCNQASFAVAIPITLDTLWKNGKDLRVIGESHVAIPITLDTLWKYLISVMDQTGKLSRNPHHIGYALEGMLAHRQVSKDPVAIPITLDTLWKLSNQPFLS